jgi:glycosyltransferase involved in cell wall biosynthesis
MSYFLKDIWPLIKKKDPQVRLIIVGGNIPRHILELGKEGSDILVTGYVEDVRPYVWASSVLIVPLRFGGGTKLKVLDALAMGKAIVSTSIGLEGIAVTPGKEAIQADGAEEFAEAVVDLLRFPERRLELGEAGRKLVEERYDWSKIGKLQQEIFEKLTQEVR